DKQTIHSYGHARPRQRMDKTRPSAGFPLSLIGLLIGVSTVQDHRKSNLLHNGYGSHIDEQLMIPKGCPTFGEHRVIIAGLNDLVHGKWHGLRGYKLTFFDVVDAAGLSSCLQ